MNTRIIPLSRGKFTLVDAKDYEYLMQWKWCAWPSKNKSFYATRKLSYSGGVSMSRLILQAPVGVLVDHKNGNTLDNTRKNLRLCSHNQNVYNSRKYKNNTSGFKGVSWDSSVGSWRARIQYEGKCVSLGYFDTAEEAGEARKKVSERFHGSFVRHE